MAGKADMGTGAGAASDVADGSEAGFVDLLAGLGKAAEETVATLSDGLGDAEDAVRDGLEGAESTIREHPLLAVGIAAGLGFVLGLLMRGAASSDER